MDSPLIKDFEMAVTFKTASGKQSESIVIDSTAELDAITEINVDTVWHNYTKDNVLYLALDWVYMSEEHRFYQVKVEE